jgi:hypothetical protein
MQNTSPSSTEIVANMHDDDDDDDDDLKSYNKTSFDLHTCCKQVRGIYIYIAKH